ncbi:MAG: YlbF family regulator [Clostridia bacterium]|jgi:cell fate (sporulation/competence/biofilm development) regulator YlbF (YheA/YmcA/DUF963 family)|nr:YlbF family regulator [Clostridia bacterium]
MELIEMAAILGQRIRASEAGQRLENAAKAYAEDPELRSAFTEYQVQQKVLEEQGNLEVKDEALITAIDKRLNEIYDQIIAHEIYKEYEQAQEAYNNLVSNLIGEVVRQANGDQEGQCTHDCSTCGGCH